MAEEKLAVYFMDNQGRYNDPTWLPATEAAVMAIRERKKYHEIRVTDIGDNLCMHILEGEILFPNREDVRDFYKYLIENN